MLPMKKLGVAVIGVGAVAPAHINGYLAQENCEVLALCDNFPEKAQKLADRISQGMIPVSRPVLCPTMEVQVAITVSSLLVPVIEGFFNRDAK